jgi:hypothetical protein
MKRLPWKYLAGFIDGEGCIDVQVTKLKGNETVFIRPRLRIAQVESCKFLFDMMQNSLGGHICNRKFDNPKWQNALSIEWAGYNPACKVLRNIVNSLFLKKEQARFCLWMETDIKGKHVSTEVRDAIREELKLMKRDPHRLSETAQKRISEML